MFYLPVVPRRNGDVARVFFFQGYFEPGSFCFLPFLYLPHPLPSVVFCPASSFCPPVTLLGASCVRRFELPVLLCFSFALRSPIASSQRPGLRPSDYPPAKPAFSVPLLLFFCGLPPLFSSRSNGRPQTLAPTGLGVGLSSASIPPPPLFSP